MISDTIFFFFAVYLGSKIPETNQSIHCRAAEAGRHGVKGGGQGRGPLHGGAGKGAVQGARPAGLRQGEGGMPLLRCRTAGEQALRLARQCRAHPWRRSTAACMTPPTR